MHVEPKKPMMVNITAQDQVTYIWFQLQCNITFREIVFTPQPFLRMKFCYNATRRVSGYKCPPLNPLIVTGIVSINLAANSMVIYVIYILVSVLVIPALRLVTGSQNYTDIIKVGMAEIFHLFFFCTTQSVFRSYFDPRLPFSPDEIFPPFLP